MKNPKKPSKIVKNLEVVFYIPIADLKQIILKKDKEITNSDGNKQIQTF